MAKALKVLDGAALLLTGGGLLGGAFAAIGVVPAPAGIVCVAAVAVGVVACAVVRKLRPKRVVVDAEINEVDEGPTFNYPHDSLRLKNPITDPMDSSIPGTYAWKVQNDTIAKTF